VGAPAGPAVWGGVRRCHGRPAAMQFARAPPGRMLDPLLTGGRRGRCRWRGRLRRRRGRARGRVAGIQRRGQLADEGQGGVAGGGRPAVLQRRASSGLVEDYAAELLGVVGVAVERLVGEVAPGRDAVEQRVLAGGKAVLVPGPVCVGGGAGLLRQAVRMGRRFRALFQRQDCPCCATAGCLHR
jgi:hypothetical protein